MRNTTELKPAPVEPKKSMAARAKKTNDVQMETAGNIVPPAQDGVPFGQAMQSLFALAGQLRNTSPEGAGASLNPKLILTGSGLELRFSAESSEAAESPDGLAGMERSLRLLSARMAKLEEQLGSHSEGVDSLRAAVQQNEERLETLVDSLSMVDDLAQSDLCLELVPGPEALAS